MSKLGYTWYPKDWWSSDEFFEWEEYPLIKYVYREIMDFLYMKGGSAYIDEKIIWKRWHVDMIQVEYEMLKSAFVIDDDGKWTHSTVKKRLSKAESARENGKKGGRPKNPKTQNNNPTEKPTETQAKTHGNPPLEREREREREREKEGEIKETDSPPIFSDSTDQTETQDPPLVKPNVNTKAKEAWMVARPDWVWSPDSYGQMKSLLAKIRAGVQHHKKMQGNPYPNASDTEIITGLEYFLKNLPKFYQHKDPKQLSWKYDEVRSEILAKQKERNKRPKQLMDRDSRQILAEQKALDAQQ